MSFRLSAVLVSLALGVLLGFSAAWSWQASNLDAVSAEYKGFVDTTRALGDAAQTASLEQEARDKVEKTKADNENKLTITALRADVKRLRNARASSNYLPGPAPDSRSPDVSCFDRTELEQSLRSFDAGIQGLVDEGSEAAVNLNTARRWTQP